MASDGVTNWKAVTPANRKRIDAIVKHYMKSPHPFTACVRDNTKRFGEDRAKRICAVVKDMGERTTKWRKGPGKKVVEAAVTEDAAIAAAFDEAMAPTLDAAGVTVDELAGWVEDAQAAGLLLEAGCDLLTPEQLVVAAPAAAERLATLERLGLPEAGPGALLDRRVVEAAAGGSRLASARRALHDRAEGKTTGTGSGRFDESKHRRGFGGKFVTTGASGREVRAVQRRVGARVDGDFGTKTKAAVIKFQKAHGLVADGVVGRQTVAALRGRKDAKRVKVGELAKGDREFLRGHVRGNGKRKRLVEAVAVGSLLQRVRDLKPGEHAMLPDGGAVRHSYTPDGREVWTAGRPVTWNEDRISWSDTESRRTPEEAVVDALTASARRNDPESVGGPTAWFWYADCLVNGQPATFRGVNENGDPIVRLRDVPNERVTSWSSITLPPPDQG